MVATEALEGSYPEGTGSGASRPVIGGVCTQAPPSSSTTSSSSTTRVSSGDPSGEEGCADSTTSAAPPPRKTPAAAAASVCPAPDPHKGELVSATSAMRETFQGSLRSDRRVLPNSGRALIVGTRCCTRVLHRTALTRAVTHLTTGAFPTGPQLSAKKRSYPHTGSACIHPTLTPTISHRVADHLFSHADGDCGTDQETQLLQLSSVRKKVPEPYTLQGYLAHKKTPDTTVGLCLEQNALP